MDREEVVEFIYHVIQCKGKTLDCIGKDCTLCMAEKLANYIECK